MHGGKKRRYVSVPLSFYDGSFGSSGTYRAYIRLIRLICLIVKDRRDPPLNAVIMKMQGLSLASVKKHPTLIPLYFCIVLGGCGAFLYTLRLATRSPDVSWLNKKEAEPWNDYKDKMYKFYATKDEIKTAKSPAPEY